METSLKTARLRRRLMEKRLQRKKLVEENYQLGSSVKDLLGLQHQVAFKLLSNVTNNEIYFSQSRDAKHHSIAEGVVADISRALIQAQEEERARIARELHDDINQRLALLAIGIEQVGEGLPPQVQSHLRKLQQQVTEISTDIHAMAHELHCSSLDYLGLVPAVRKLARELGRRQDIEIEVKDDGVPKHLPSEISLCLFRVIQEALHNAAKHSGAKRFEIHLHKMADQIHVTLRDTGKGFDIEAVRNGKGLGLASMQERISMVKGKIMIRSEQAVGTSIQAWVPLQANTGSRTANC